VRHFAVLNAASSPPLPSPVTNIADISTLNDTTADRTELWETTKLSRQSRQWFCSFISEIVLYFLSNVFLRPKHTKRNIYLYFNLY
jgi:hypothetical protein